VSVPLENVTLETGSEAPESNGLANGSNGGAPHAIGTRRSPVLVHDYLLVMRGAERTFAAIADCWPDAPIYTLLYDRSGTDGAFAERTINTSYLQRLGVRQHGFRRLLPLFPAATERLTLEASDLVVSSTSAFAHGIHAPEGAIQVAYCHSPFRYAWHARRQAVDEAPAPVRPLVRRTLERIRRWDIEASTRVTHYVANSELSRQRIQDFYGRDAVVVHPPVDVDRFSVAEPGGSFLVVTEIVPHKLVRNALEAARRARVRIDVVGGGPERAALEREFGQMATFHGRVSDERLAELYGAARALVVPNVEEFGIAAVEGQASGRPVLAADAGGARETVVPGRTGVLVPPDDVEALAEAMSTVDWDAFDPFAIQAHAQRFSTDAFKRRFTAEVERLAGSRNGRPG
jgi:glycosyltransferase involved in cell wall biosynthesis